MPFATNRGVRIHYEVEGEGPPLVLQHGLGASLGFWRMAGYVEPLRDDYQLILIDHRGHGSSDKPHDPEAYKLALEAADVVAVLDDLHLGKAHYCGYSMGGWLGWGIAKYAPGRFSSLIIGGASPYGTAPAGPSVLDIFKQGMEATLAAARQMFGPRWTPEKKTEFAANDLEALIAGLSVQEELDIEDLLPATTLPCLLFGGDLDPFHAGAAECAKRMPNATAVSLPGLDHIEAVYRSDLVLPHITRFLAQVRQA